MTANNNQEEILNYKYHIDIGAKQTIDNIYPYKFWYEKQDFTKILECHSVVILLQLL